MGRYSEGMEGAALGAICDSTEKSIWIGGGSAWLGVYRANRELPPPSDVPDYLQHKAEILAKVPTQESTGVEMIVGCGYPGLWAAVYGRFETNDDLPLHPKTGERLGFGHLGIWPTQLVSPSAGFWCLVPPDKYQAVIRDISDREEQGRLALWRALKAELQRPNGTKYFDASVKGRLFPKVRGFVVSTDLQDPARVIEVAVLDSLTPEATLRLDRPLSSLLEPGTRIEFDGVAVEFTLKPYRIVFDVARAELRIGWQKE